jgi:hypothetical protein
MELMIGRRPRVYIALLPVTVSVAANVTEGYVAAVSDLGNGMAGAGVHMSAAWFIRLLVIVVLLSVNARPLVRAEDTVTDDRPLSGDRKLISRGGKFALGFFQPDGGVADRWYVGIWYHNISMRTPVWVANRDRPVSDPAASRLTTDADGNIILILLDASGSIAWSTNATANTNATVAAVLHDTGNLVLAPSRHASAVLWQSFDHMGDTWLPGGKLHRDKVTGAIQGMTSWRGPTRCRWTRPARSSTCCGGTARASTGPRTPGPAIWSAASITTSC